MVIRTAALTALIACADDPCPRGSMTESVGGLVVTEAEHPTGWGQAECASCHAFDALHLQSCTPEADLVAVQELVDAEGVDACAACHGDNGLIEGEAP